MHHGIVLANCFQQISLALLTPLLSLLFLPQSEFERSASLHRATLDQLETIKSDLCVLVLLFSLTRKVRLSSSHSPLPLSTTFHFGSYSFLAMFHPDDAAAPSSVRPAAAGASTVTSSHYATSLKEDMSDLRRRLEVLSSSAQRSSSFPHAHTQSGRLSSIVYGSHDATPRT